MDCGISIPEPPIEVSSTSRVSEEQIGEVVLDFSGMPACSMSVVEPCVTYISSGSLEMSEKDKSIKLAVDTLLRTLATALSCWYLEMKDAVGRGRAMQSEERARQGLSKHAKVPWVHPGLTPKNLATAASMEAVVESMFGSGLSTYAAERFKHAVDTGDMRSFKLRLLMLRARDLLKGLPLYEPFRNGVDDAITFAEQRSGCIPCPGPRRMSRAEQERKRLREQSLSGTVPNRGISDDKIKDNENKTSNLKKKQKPSKTITDDELAKRVRLGDISPGKALLMMLNNESKATSKPPISKKMPFGTVPDVDGTVPRKKRKRSGTVPQSLNDLSSSDLEKMADDILRQEYGTTFREGEEQEGDERDRGEAEYGESRGYGHSYGYGFGYGKYNASGSEWCPDDD